MRHYNPSKLNPKNPTLTFLTKTNAFSIIFCYNAPKNLRQGNFMSKKVRVEKTIDLHKIPLSALIVALFGMIAFAFVNAEKLPIFKLCALIGGIILVATAIGIIVWQCVKNLKKLEDL